MYARIITLVALGALLAPGTALGDEYIVQVTGDFEDAVEAIEAAGGTVTGQLEEVDLVGVQSDDEDFVDTLEALSEVSSAAPDLLITLDGGSVYSGTVAADPGGEVDPSDDWAAPLQWGLEAVSASDAWDAGYTGAGVRICVLDTGVDSDHIDLADNLNTELSTSFVEGDTYEAGTSETDFHATMVAGIIAAADNDYGVVGVAPDAEIVVVRVISEEYGYYSFWTLAQGLYYAAEIECDIINMSIGGVQDRSDLTPWYSQWIAYLTHLTKYANKQGATLIAAAGNSAIDADGNGDQVIQPADLPGVIAVSALGPLGWGLDDTVDLDEPAYYTNYGTSLVDFSAPGGNLDWDLYADGDECTLPSGLGTIPCWALDMVIAPFPGDFVTWGHGTSFAAPHAAGIAALIVEANGGSMKPAHLETALKAYAEDLGKSGNDDYYGQGRVSAAGLE